MGRYCSEHGHTLTDRFDFTWALKLANDLDPEGKWSLDVSDYGFSVALGCLADESAFWLARAGCNIYGPSMNLNEEDARESKVRDMVIKVKAARRLHRALGK